MPTGVRTAETMTTSLGEGRASTERKRRLHDRGDLANIAQDESSASAISLLLGKSGAYDETIRGIADRRARSGGGGGGGGGGAEAWNGDGAAKCYKMRVSDGDFAASLWEEDAMRCRTRTQTWL